MMLLSHFEIVQAGYNLAEELRISMERMVYSQN